ncbi:hypothetical protein QAD02_012054 [Eretmocerus hayati]|uniref:Uncharacterized protein n=1 Tax=Eretmocerus hayati TaxID=131215 RepID=A0ACC2NYI9_9HYME|nr:hypothetical protein QAD02_012054 [Eretmocerus hayati]
MSRIEQAFAVSVMICLALSTFGSEASEKPGEDKKSATPKSMVVYVRQHPDHGDPGTTSVTEGIEKTTALFVSCDNSTMAPRARCTIHVQDYEFNSTSKIYSILRSASRPVNLASKGSNF